MRERRGARDRVNPHGRGVRVLLRCLRILLFPVPLRLGLRCHLVSEEGTSSELRLDAGPWGPRADRALLHIRVGRQDRAYWTGILRRIRASRKRPAFRPLDAARKLGKALRSRSGNRHHSPRRPGLRGSVRLLRGISGGLRFRLADASGHVRSACFVLNPSGSGAPRDLLTIELSEAVLEELLAGRLQVATALIRQDMRVHGNVGLVADLEKWLPAPVQKTYRPLVYTERTDHPLDKGYAVHRQTFVPLLTAACILKLEGMTRKGPSFRFAARGYDVYRTRVFGMLHAYDTSEDIPWERLTLGLDWVAPGVFRLRCARGDEIRENDTPMLSGPVPDCAIDLTCEEHEDRYEIASPELRLVLHRDDFRIEVLGPEGRVTVIGARQGDGFMNLVDTLPLGFVSDRETGRDFAVNSFRLAPGEAVFGFGEHYGTVNKRGQTVSLWTEEGMGHCTGRNYKNVPFFMSTAGYGVFVNASLPMTFFVGSRFYPRHEVAVEGDGLDMFFFFGPSLKRIQGAYTELTGRAPMVPEWTFGLWVSRISYMSQEEVLETARRIRRGRWPADVIHLDTGWFAKDWQCDWRFDGRRFPDPEAMIRELHEANLRICLWQWPYLVTTLPLLEEAEARGALAAGEVPALGSLRIRHIDFTKPEGVTWYQEQLDRLFAMGADAIKADFGEYVEDHLRFQAGGGRAIKNLYPLLYQRAAFEAAERRRPGEAVLWARSGYAGSQRYPVHWSGDSASTFEDMLCALRGGLCLGLSGFTFWSNDVGGFTGTPSDALYARWTAWSIFNSHMRLHGGPPRFREPWNYAPETQQIFRDLVGLRYRLMPYLLSEARRSARQGLPVLRHLAFEFQEDPTSWNVEDQFMFGEAILVAPILTEHGTRNVWIPPGTWYEAWTGEELRGPVWIRVTTPPDRVPLYFRGGRVVVTGPERQYVGEPVSEAVTLKVFPDERGRARMDVEGADATSRIEAGLADRTARLTVTNPARDYRVEIHGSRPVDRVELNGRSVENCGAGCLRKSQRGIR